MAQVEGSLARKLDFGEAVPTDGRQGGSRALRLAAAPAGLRGPDKYKVLEHRRRQAQIAARRLLALCE